MHKIGSQNSLLDYYLHFILGSLNNNKTAILTLWLTLLYFFENATPMLLKHFRLNNIGNLHVF